MTPSQADFEGLRQGPLPDEMRILLAQYPRHGWDTHANFKQATRHWLGAHRMFRRVAALIQTQTQHYINKDRDPQDYAAHLSYYGQGLVSNLHGHHSWEDREYFPELSAADPRFDAGLAVLELDHQVLDEILDRFSTTTKLVTQAIRLGDSSVDRLSAHDGAGKLLGIAGDIEALLKRHLADEEDLAVPIILHHKLRG